MKAGANFNVEKRKIAIFTFYNDKIIIK